MTWLRRSFALNTKSLALFRIGFALIILVDVFYRFFDASAFYTDYGVLTREILESCGWLPIKT